MARLKARHLNEVDRSLERIEDVLSGHGAAMEAIRRELERVPLVPEAGRLESLLGGVRVALERMGGNVLPGVVADIHALRDQMGEFRRELAGYRGALMRLENWLDEINQPPVAECNIGPRPGAAGGKRRYNRHKKGGAKDHPQVEISMVDVAPHNDEPSGIES